MLRRRSGASAARDGDDRDNPYPRTPERVGRLVDDDEGGHGRRNRRGHRARVGTEGGGYTAEESAMHIDPEA